MLCPLKKEEWPLIADAAWKLTQRHETASFPTYLDGVATRKDFETRVSRALMDPSEKLLKLTDDAGAFHGLVQYFVLKEDKYIQTVHFLTEDGWQEQALTELLAHCRACYAGMALEMGFPAENERVAAWMAGNLQEPQEESMVWMADLTSLPASPLPSAVKPITEQTLPVFRRLHDCVDMYWTTERILARKEQWMVLLHQTSSTLYAQRGNTLAEIFGVDYAGDFDAEGFVALIRACQQLARTEDNTEHLCYFTQSEQETQLLATLGFRFVCRYRAYNIVC